MSKHSRTRTCCSCALRGCVRDETPVHSRGSGNPGATVRDSGSPLARGRTERVGRLCATSFLVGKARFKVDQRSKIRGVWLKYVRAAHSVCSPPQPNPGLPGFGQFQNLPEAGKPAAGWGGVGGGGPSADHRTTPTPALRSQACAGCASLPACADPPHKGEGRTEFAAHLIPSHPNARYREIARERTR